MPRSRDMSKTEVVIPQSLGALFRFRRVHTGLRYQ